MFDAATALVVIDVQSGMFGAEHGPPIHAGEALLASIATLLARARAAGSPVIYVRHDGGKGDMLEYGAPAWEIHAAIAPRPGERIVDKRTPDSFHETTLAAELAAAGAARLVLCGAQTEYCVDTTCRRAAALGYPAVLVADAHSTWDNGVLTATQIIAHTNRTLAGGFVRLAHAEEGRA